jgi:small subunit ribosomal protein S1
MQLDEKHNVFPEEIRNMSAAEKFEILLEEHLSTLKLEKGAVVKAKILKITTKQVIVDAGLKTEDIIPIEEFRKEPVSQGDIIEVAIVSVENGFGETRLSRTLARRAQLWTVLTEAYKTGEIVEGVILQSVNGGFIVSFEDTVYGFLPRSQVDVKPIRDPSYLQDKPIAFKVVKIDNVRNNVVVSRRAVLEGNSAADQKAKFDELQEGQELKGIVKNIQNYGVFVDLGGIDGLVHVTDISWKRIKHPEELLQIGDEIRVKVLKFDQEKTRVSLGIKQLTEDPWKNLAARYPTGTRIRGRVTNITDYGCFVELEEGIEGLVHMSEMDWTNKNIHPSKVVKPTQEVDVMVLELDEERRRISLGLKQCCENPWQEFSMTHRVGETVTGKTRSITDFGIFVGLTGNIDGLIHLSDLSWTLLPEDAIKQYKKGQEVTAKILAIDADRERISLGLKQLEVDPLSEFLELHPEGSTVKGVVTEISPKQATIELGTDIIGTLHVSEFSHERINGLDDVLKVQDEVEARIIRFDGKNRTLILSIKALSEPSTKENTQPRKQQKSFSADTSKVTLGDLLKEQMKKDQSE